MPQNYSQFSESIENITDDERAWLEKVLDVASDEDYDEEVIQERLTELGVTNHFGTDYFETWPAFQWDFETRKFDGVTITDLWIHAEEHFDMDHILAVVTAFFQKFRPAATFVMTWADYCDAPRIAQFGGGAVKITANDYTMKTTEAYRVEWECLEVAKGE